MIITKNVKDKNKELTIPFCIRCPLPTECCAVDDTGKLQPDLGTPKWGAALTKS